MFNYKLPIKMFRQQNGLYDPKKVPLSIGWSQVTKFKTDISKKYVICNYKCYYLNETQNKNITDSDHIDTEKQTILEELIKAAFSKNACDKKLATYISYLKHVKNLFTLETM